MKNRFNRLTSKEWLPFQKSWFRYESDEKMIRENIRFFCKAEPVNDVMAWWGPSPQTAASICQENDIVFRELISVGDEAIQFAMLDVRHFTGKVGNEQEYYTLRSDIIARAMAVFHKLEYKRFMCVLVSNRQIGNTYYPFAWDLAKALSSVFSLKDEKIACIEKMTPQPENHYFVPQKEIFYCLYFKKDDNAEGVYHEPRHCYFTQNRQQKGDIEFDNAIPSWFILKPQPRKKSEILHPAKYPEELVTLFVNEFSLPGQNVFDPMSGTGSTQLGAMRLGRNGYGTELSDFFAGIALERCEGFLAGASAELFTAGNQPQFKILHKDARAVQPADFPPVDYLLSSPPYWDMLNMKGAENQAKRLKLGLQTNYSDSDKDLGNIADYNDFVNHLVEIYFGLLNFVKPGGYITIVVKNIKKKGRNYPFAWDLANALQEKLILLPETFWCQDDISIAPYGYGNTWVSNTFHQYCLNFQKPLP